MSIISAEEAFACEPSSVHAVCDLGSGLVQVQLRLLVHELPVAFSHSVLSRSSRRANTSNLRARCYCLESYAESLQGLGRQGFISGLVKT